MAVVASALVTEGGPLSARIRPARRYAQSGEINFENEEKEAALVALERAYPTARVDELDGVTLDLGSWWCNVRMSNTEPLLRLNLEAADDRTVAQKVKEVSTYLGRRVEH
jgi:phosphomannomutase